MVVLYSASADFSMGALDPRLHKKYIIWYKKILFRT